MENLKEIDIIITLITGTLVMFLMAGVIVFSVIKYQKRVLRQKEELRLAEKKYQIDLLDATINATEKERESVAKNIHDEIGTLISVVKMNNSRLKKNIDNADLALELVNTNNQILLEINESVRSISNDLMSPTLSKLGFARALDQLCLQINNSGEVNISVESEEPELRFNSKAEIQLFRVCKEIINNILKHSHSSKIIINIKLVSTSLSISINYDGKGINDGQAKSIMENNRGLGLKSIYGRIQVLNGVLNYFTESESNSSVVLKIPISN